MISPKIFPSQMQRKLLMPQVRPGWSPQCSDVMPLSGSANSELGLLSEGAEAAPFHGQEDRKGTWRINAGVV